MNLVVTGSVDHASRIILPFFESKLDWAIIAKFTGIARQTKFAGKLKEVEVLHHPTSETIVYLVGLGGEEDKSKIAGVFRKLAFDFHESWDKAVTVIVSHLNVDVVREATIGIALARYKLGRLKTAKEETKPFYSDGFVLEIVVKEKDGMAKDVASEGLLIAEAQINAMHWVDTPPNIKTPEYLSRQAMESAKKYGFKTEIMYKHDLEVEGLRALLAVGQGSSHPPLLLKLEYKPEGSASKRPKLGLVGKGVTFDTGGISLKPSSNMHYMKSDMAGAATVLATVGLVAKLKLNIHLVAVIPIAENSIDANSVRPGDVIGSYAGKSIEVIDTDAEGRLILADALSYIKNNYYPEMVIDLATLTGSSVQTFGYATAAMFSNSDSMCSQLEESGKAVGERVWRLPLWDDYKDDLHSDVADIRNFSGKPVAGAITAAKFLEVFITGHPQWAHLDIAGVAFGDSPYAKMKSATGYGVRLLHEFVKGLVD